MPNSAESPRVLPPELLETPRYDEGGDNPSRGPSAAHFDMGAALALVQARHATPNKTATPSPGRDERDVGGDILALAAQRARQKRKDKDGEGGQPPISRSAHAAAAAVPC